jgi:hypothetical protein
MMILAAHFQTTLKRLLLVNPHVQELAQIFPGLSPPVFTPFYFWIFCLRLPLFAFGTFVAREFFVPLWSPPASQPLHP